MQGRGRTRRRANATVTTLILLALILAGLGAWTFTGGAASSGWHDDLDEGFAVAARDGRPTMVLFTADWCPPCRHFKREILHDAEVEAHLEREFVLVKVDLSDRRGPNNAVAEEFGVRSIPRIMAFDAEGVHRGTFEDRWTPDTFLRWADRVRD